MTEVARIQQQPTAMQAKIAYAQELANSGLLPAAYRRQPANVLWAVEYGEMLGLSPMAAITGIHVIEGKPTASAGLISALVRRAGHKLRITGDDKRAVAEIVRADDPDFTFRSEWTLDRARIAELLGKGTWKKYPAAMLKARAITEAARDACEEALSGVHYTPEELGAEVDEDGAVIAVQVQAENVTPPQVETDEAWLTDVTDRIGKIDDTDTARALWIEVSEKTKEGVCSQQDCHNLKVLLASHNEALAKRAENAPVDAEVVEENYPAETDREWADGFEIRVNDATSVGVVRGLGAELDSQIGAGKVAEHDIDTYRQLVTMRITELTVEPEPAGAMA